MRKLTKKTAALFLLFALLLTIVPPSAVPLGWTGLGGAALAVDFDGAAAEIAGNLEAMAANFERNLATAQEIMDAGGFLAPIGAQ
jgi:hypothetical protein